jgi:hypothetical protein
MAAGLGGVGAGFIACGRVRDWRCHGKAGSGSAEAAIADFSQRRSFFMVKSLAVAEHRRRWGQVD